MGKNIKTALITGASSGLGKIFCEKLAVEGFKVTGVARSQPKLQKVISSLGKEHTWIQADLTRPEELETVSEAIRQNRYGVLINSAGSGLHGRFNENHLPDYENMMTLNMNVLVRLTYQYLQKAGEGDAVINVSSALSEIPMPGGAVYSGTKGFVSNFTEALWYENKARDVYLMALLPGLTKTNFQHVAGNGKYELNNGHGEPPEVVVTEALRALKRRKIPVLVSGPKYRRLLFWAKRLFTKRQQIALIANYSPAMNGTPQNTNRAWKTSWNN